MAVSKSYSRERKYHCRLLVEITKWKRWMEVILNNFQKTSSSFYFQNTLLTLLHLVLIKRFPNMSHVDTKISEASDTFSIIWAISKFDETYSIQLVRRENIQNQDYSLVSDSVFMPNDGPTSKGFILILFLPNTLSFSDSATIRFTLNWNLLLLDCQGNHPYDKRVPFVQI